MAWRFAVGGISHKTNSFSPIRTGMKHFAERESAEGQEILLRSEGTRTSIGGFLSFACETGSELIPTIAASAVLSGIVHKDAYDLLKSKLLSGIAAAYSTCPLDDVLLALHGAMVVEGIPQRRGRHPHGGQGSLVGAGVPIVSTLDFHANLTDMMVTASNGLFGYNAYFTRIVGSTPSRRDASWRAYPRERSTRTAPSPARSSRLW